MNPRSGADWLTTASWASFACSKCLQLKTWVLLWPLLRESQRFSAVIHLSLPQTDFLPFTCDKCNSTFCLDHRTYGTHSCPKADHGESTTIACPLCAKAIAVPWQADPNAVFEQHTASDCDPSHWAKVHAKRRCPVPGCKEKLVASNTYECRDCGTTVCLKHRFSTDHACKERKGMPFGAACTARTRKVPCMQQCAVRCLPAVAKMPMTNQ